jgi:HSP20 family protein
MALKTKENLEMLVSYQKPFRTYPSILDWVMSTEPADRTHEQKRHHIAETEQDYRTSIDIPGVSKDGIWLTVEDRLLRLKTRREFDGQTSERSFEWRLPRHADADQINARLENGVLELTIKKAAQSMPREISVETVSA